MRLVQQAVHFAAQGVMSGTPDLVVAGGVQNMSPIPISSAMLVGQQYGFTTPTPSRRLAAPLRRPGGLAVPLRRDDRRAVEHLPRGHGGVRPTSHQRAIAAIRRGHFDHEIIGVGDFRTDEGPRETSLEKMAGCSRSPRAAGSPPRWPPRSGTAPALLIASEQAVNEHGLTPAPASTTSRARRRPGLMLTGPIPATRHALEQTGLSIDDIDLVEINEAFAPVVLAWMKETDADPSGQRQRRRDRARPPDRRHRHPDHGHPAQRARAHRRPLRPADDVRGRRQANVTIIE